MKRVYLLIFSVVFALVSCMPLSVSAKSTDSLPDFSGMTLEELNSFIDTMCSLSTSSENHSNNNYNLDEYNAAQLAWLAAAQAARIVGLECCARLLTCSVTNSNYTEYNGTVAAEIQTTSADAYWLQHWSQEHTITFNISDNADLAYSIHVASMSLSGNSSGATAHLSDTFDFASDTDLQGFLAQMLNNWGYLSQNAGVLHQISVNIYITL